ncbi:MAG: hypothetical protein ABEK59_05450, partial [Halobacteria archaeon]
MSLFRRNQLDNFFPLFFFEVVDLERLQNGEWVFPLLKSRDTDNLVLAGSQKLFERDRGALSVKVNEGTRSLDASLQGQDLFKVPVTADYNADASLTDADVTNPEINQPIDASSQSVTLATEEPFLDASQGTTDSSF